MNNVRLNADPKNGAVVDVTAIASWNGVEAIADILQEYHNGVVTDKTEGPDARVWEIIVGRARIVIVHDDILGNRIFAPGGGHDSLMQSLAISIESAIS